MPFEKFQSYINKEPSGGSLHIVLYDENVDKHSIEWCLKYAQENNDSEAVELAVLLLQMTIRERRRLVEKLTWL